MKKWFMIYLLAIIVFAATTPAKAEVVWKELPDKFGIMIKMTETETVIKGGITYECTKIIYKENGKEYVNGVIDRCFPISTDSQEDPQDSQEESTSEEDEPTICNGCPNINVSTPMKTFKNNRIKIIR